MRADVFRCLAGFKDLALHGGPRSPIFLKGGLIWTGDTHCRQGNGESSTSARPALHGAKAIFAKK